MTDTEILQAIKRQLLECAGWDGDELATDREKALDYYHQRPNGTEVEGRSQAVSGDVSAMVESNLAAMMQSFSSSRIVEFDSLSADDESQAQLESDACAFFVMKKNNGRWQLGQAIKETLRLRNGWVKAWIEERRTTRIQEYVNVAPEALLELTERPGVECTVLEYDPEKDGGYLKTRCVYVDRRFSFGAVAPGNMFYPKAYDGCDFEALQRIPIIAERRIDTRATLVEMGFPKAAVDRCTEYRADTNTSEAARNPRRNSQLTPGLDFASQLVEWFEAYVLLDGVRHKVCCDGKFQEKFAKGEHELVPYGTGQCFITPHRLTGLSIWDKLRQTQDINTGLTRGMLDNVEATSKSRTAHLDEVVNADDLGDGRVNGSVRVRGFVPRVADAIMPLVVPDTSAGIVRAIDYQRRIRTELGGSSLDMQAGEMQLSDRVGSQGLDRAYSVAEQLAQHMTQNIADTLIRSAFLLAHAVLRENFDEPVPIKVGGRWKSAIPSEWIEREELTVKIGKSPGERARLMAVLDKMLQTHLQLEQLGFNGILTDLEGFYALLMDWARLGDVPHPERYYLDPQSEGSVAAQQQRAQAAQAREKQQTALVTEAVNLQKIGEAGKKYDGDADRAVRVWEKKVDTKLEYAKLGQQGEVEEAKLVMPAAAKMLEEHRGQKTGRAKPKGKSAAGRGAKAGKGAST
jgi:hypothetical protein